jgi:hypothetical protein
MGSYNIVNQANLQSGQPEDVSVVLANLQAIQAVLNGGIDNSNINAAAAILASKLAGYPTDATKVLKGDGTWLTPPGYEFAYVESQAGLSVVATTEATAQDFVSAGPITFDGATTIIVDFWAPILSPANDGVGRQISAVFKDASTSLGVFQLIVNEVAGVTIYEQSVFRRKLTPSAGSHTYKVAAYVSGATGSLSGGPGGVGQYQPAFIRVTKA